MKIIRFLHLLKVKPLLVLALFIVSFQLSGQTCTTKVGDNLGSPVPPIGTGGFPCTGGPTVSTATMGAPGTVGTDWTISSVDIDITHTWDADLEIDLVSPTGTILDLSSDNGGSGDNFTNTVFMDGNPSITTGSAPFTGTFQPEGGTLNGTFDGEVVAGSWTLEICDDSGGDSGAFHNFEITFCEIDPCTTLTGDNLGTSIPVTGTGGFPCTGGPRVSTATMGAAGTIGTDTEIMSVDIDITHTWDADLEIDLVSPAGTILDLSSDNGGAGDNFTNTVFMDGNPSITTGGAPFTGTFQPEGGTFASTFAGESITGDWSLEICDDSGGDNGTLNNFQITFCPMAPPACVTADEAPMIDTPCPGDIERCGAQTVSWTEPTATDNCDTPTMSSTHSPGDAFAVGTTTVTYTFTDLAGLTATCSFDVIINPLPMVQVQAYNLAPFCQGIKELYVKVGNAGALTAPITYAWSHGLGTNQTAIPVLNNTIYSVSVTDAEGCTSIAMYNLSVDMSNLLSAHVLVGDDELELYQSEVQSGGVGMRNANEDVNIHNNSHILTFLESEVIDVDGMSTVNNYINGPSTLTLPPFIVNPNIDNNDVVVPFGATTTLSGTNYGNITVMSNATLIFDNPNVYVKNLVSKPKATISFNQASNLMVRGRVDLGSRNTFNAANMDVVLYIGDDFSVSQGSIVNTDVFSEEGIQVNDSGSSMFSYMSGLFITNDGIESGDNVIWNWNVGCGTSAVAVPLIGQINTGDVATTVEKKGLSIYPNPSNGTFTLGVKDYMDSTIDITIYNTIGEIVWASHVNKVETTTFAVDLSSSQFSNGIYLISIASEGKVETKSLVLNR